MRNLNATDLDAYVGQNISAICGCSFTDNSDNHCAHFVCHAKEYTFGLTCFGMTGKGTQAERANIRVQEVFAQCLSVGRWADKPQSLTTGFIFITQAGNVNLTTGVMANVRRKHIGIFIGQDVWQYKNAVRQVVKQTPAIFGQHYTGAGYATFYGEFPL